MTSTSGGTRGAPGALRGGALSTRTEAIAVTAVVALVYYLLRPDALASLGVLYDDVLYMSLGKAIAAGQGYRAIHLVGEPVHAMAPPGLPALLAMLWIIGRDLETTARLALLLADLATGAAAGLLWYYSRNGLRNDRFATAVFVVGPLLLERTIRFFSGAVTEPWFVLGWAASLLLFDRMRDAESPPVRMRNAAALGAVLAATTLFRTQALALIVAHLFGIVMARSGRRALVVCGLVAILPPALWLWWQGSATPEATASPDQAGYLGLIPHGDARQVLDYLTYIVRANVASYARLGAELLVGWASPKAAWLLFAYAVVVAVGCWKVRRRAPALALGVPLTVALLLLWGASEVRYLASVMPFAGLSAAYLFHRLTAGWRAPLRLAVRAGIAAVAVYIAVVNWEIRRPLTPRPPPRAGSLTAAFRDASAWIRANTAPGDRIMVDYPAAYYLRTGRKTVGAIPEQGLSGPSLFAIPGRYFAARILADSITVLIDHRPKAYQGTELPMTRSLAAIRERCAGVLQPQPPVPAGADPSPAYYRVVRDEACLRTLVGG